MQVLKKRKNVAGKKNKKARIIFCIITGMFLIVGLIRFNSNSRKGDGVQYGTDINVVKNGFKEIENIQQCYYKITKIGDVNVNFGPTSYQIETVILINGEESQMLKEQYEWEEAVPDIDDTLLEQSNNVEKNILWSQNSEFEKLILQGHFVGSVYFSSESNAIYICAENL